MARRFDDQVVVVTGAGQGLGREIAFAFADAGASVALAARSTAKLESVAEEIGARGGRALAIECDVGDADSVAALSDSVTEQLGAVDVLVNNAGIGGPTAVLWEQPLEEWERTLRVNLTGVFLCCRAFVPAMVDRGRGNVVVVGSMSGKRPLYGRTPYAASKLGLVGLVRTLAWEVGPAGVRVNLVSPGPVSGDRIESVIANQASARDISVAEARLEFTRISPMQRLVEPREVAAAVLYLTSDDSSGVTGEDLNVSAGTVMFG